MRRISSGNESEDKYFFVPHIDFVESGKYSFPENDFNISPLSKLLPVIYLSLLIVTIIEST
jgi:hypothetical protein